MSVEKIRVYMAGNIIPVPASDVDLEFYWDVRRVFLGEMSLEEMAQETYRVNRLGVSFVCAAERAARLVKKTRVGDFDFKLALDIRYRPVVAMIPKEWASKMVPGSLELFIASGEVDFY